MTINKTKSDPTKMQQSLREVERKPHFDIWQPPPELPETEKKLRELSDAIAVLEADAGNPKIGRK